MAIVKCSTCKKNVPDDAALCPHCGNDLDKAVYCPKCGSADTSVLLKWKNGEVKRFFLTELVYYFLHWRVARHAHKLYDEIEYSTSVRHVCNSCGKKFKSKK